MKRLLLMHAAIRNAGIGDRDLKVEHSARDEVWWVAISGSGKKIRGYFGGTDEAPTLTLV